MVSMKRNIYAKYSMTCYITSLAEQRLLWEQHFRENEYMEIVEFPQQVE